MRICYLVELNSLAGGLQTILSLARYLTQRGHDVQVFARERHVSPVPFIERVKYVKEFETIDYSKFDIVIVTQIQDVPLLLPRLNIPLAFLMLAYEEHFFAKKPEDIHKVFAPSIRRAYALPVPKIVRSRSLEQLIEKEYAQHAFWFPPAIHGEIFYPTNRQKHRAPTVLLLGRISIPLKGISDGLEALGILSRVVRNLRVIYISPDTEDRLWLKRFPFTVEFHGWLPQSKLRELYCAADVFVSPSWYESVSQPPLEAMACGTPVVATTDLGVLNYGRDRQNLLLAQIGDPRDLAEKIFQVLKNEKLKAQLIKGGFQTAKSYCDWERSVCCFEKILEKIIRDFQRKRPRIAESECSQILKQMQLEGTMWSSAGWTVFTHALQLYRKALRRKLNVRYCRNF